ncbi:MULTISPECIES: DNA-binding protein [unclassified Pseudomonas]|uniref:DNA-binding protein n=1 Tax=unclassified Pseudomonas TaxID=196821 RepID=UPI0008384EB7|nr:MULTISPECIES: DNA-binding protein [unclassified Pseudomonas]QIH08942.1 DNA-binding protein [Pseudomonas sp. BIOMIG1BAC]
MATHAKALTAHQVKENFRRAGKTFTQWAKENGYTRNEVYRVLNGQAKANYGKAHDIAVKLGLKPTAALAA